MMVVLLLSVHRMAAELQGDLGELKIRLMILKSGLNANAFNNLLTEIEILVTDVTKEVEKAKSDLLMTIEYLSKLSNGETLSITKDSAPDNFLNFTAIIPEQRIPALIAFLNRLKSLVLGSGNVFLMPSAQYGQVEEVLDTIKDLFKGIDDLIANWINDVPKEVQQKLALVKLTNGNLSAAGFIDARFKAVKRELDKVESMLNNFKKNLLEAALPRA